MAIFMYTLDRHIQTLKSIFELLHIARPLCKPPCLPVPLSVIVSTYGSCEMQIAEKKAASSTIVEGQSADPDGKTSDHYPSWVRKIPILF